MKRKPVISIRFKLCCSYMAMVMLPTILAGVLLYTHTVGNIWTQIDARLSMALEEQTAEVRRKIQQTEEAARNFSTLNEITQYVSGRYFDESELIIAYNQRVRAAFSWFDNAPAIPMRVGFFVGNGTVTEDEHFHDKDAYRDEAWFQAIEQRLQKESLFWENAHPARDYRYARGNGSTVFSLVLSSPLLKDAFMELEVNACDLLGEGGACLKADTLELIHTCADVDFQMERERVQDACQRMVEARINGKNVLVRAQPLEELNVLLLHWTDQEEMTQEGQAALRIFFGILMPMTVLLFALTWVFSGRMSRRVQRITRAVEDMYHNRYDINLPVDSCDELGALAWHMNAMAGRIDNLLNKVLLAEMAAKDAELSALQSQINPHFIYNILETFCMMAELGDNERLSEGIAAMGELMRYNLSGKHEFTLQAELHNVEVYTALQNYVNNDCIMLSVDSDSSLDAMPIPKLLLQPLVENAILHGMEPRRTLCIDLSVRRMDGYVHIRVKNNGKPIAPARLREINRLLSQNTTDPLATFDDCLALTNISRRLKLLYDERAAVSVLSGSAGTEVLIEIPYGEEE
jgi:two-component system sensor histidine kinase YesM